MGILGYKAFHNLGGICQLLNDYPGAQHWWSRAVADAPQFLPSALALFDAALTVGDLSTAERMLHAVKTTEPEGNDAPILHARLSAARGDPPGAETALKAAVNVAPDNVQARLSLVRCLLAEERVAEAETHLHALEQADVAEAAYCLGIMAIRRGELPDALRWMERADLLNPDHAETKAQISQLKQAINNA
jgi:Tfp pilus assembly protein PilF